MDSQSITDRERQLNELVEAALPLAPPDRAAYLDRVCADEALRRDVETTIAMRDSSDPFHDITNADGPTIKLADADTLALTEDQQRQLMEETTIGPYRVVRRIGEGGMGAVYLAARDDAEFKRQVAIKLIKRGMDTEFVLRRFRNERQILAALNHPNIARLLDGGTTADGRPYFVMEYIEGQPITHYADKQRLSTVERLKLFEQVCGAIHYAHQNLVIHRDIKPSNILVTADGTLKLLDFGIAKLLNPELAAQTIEATAVAIRLMTPEYASPEQVKGETITTASDIYSLGVLLYELLTGHRPYRLAKRTMQEVARVVCEEEPYKPSTAVRRVETYPTDEGPVTLTPEVVSRTREGNPDKLRRRLAGDLDNIVLMAMRKEPQRRYASVDQLANDIRRHLTGRPVIARKDTISYRATKFIKRHKAGVIAALLILISLVVGAVATLEQRAKAERRFNDVRQLANSFLFEFHDAIKNLPGSTPARELVVKRALEYLDSLAREAGGDAQLQRELATAYQKVGDVQGNPYEANIGDTTGALASYEKALAIRAELVRKYPASIEDRHDLAFIHLRIGDVTWGTGDTEKAVAAYREGITLEESLLQNNQLDLQMTRQVWRGYHNLAYALVQAGDFNGALDSVRKGQALSEKMLANNPDDAQARHDLSVNLTTMGEVQAETGDLEGALENFRKALAIDEALAAAEPNNATYKAGLLSDHMNIGDVLDRGGNRREAIENFRKVVAIAERTTAADPANFQALRQAAAANVRLGRALAAVKQFAEALPFEQRGLELYKRIAEGDSDNQFAGAEVAYAQMYLGVALAATGKGALAVELGEKARAIAEQMSAANPANAEFRGLQAGTYAKLGEIHAALASSERQTGRQAEHWRAARNWYQRSFEMLKALKERGEWTDSEFGTPEEVAARIAQCDTVLTRLNAVSN